MHAAFKRSVRGGSQRTEERFVSESQRSQNPCGGSVRLGASAWTRINGNNGSRNIPRTDVANTQL